MERAPIPTCPKCGGHEVRDLARVRRGTGVVLVAGSLLAVALLAEAKSPIPGWSLPVVFGVFVLGVATLLGARHARYCPRCKVRMESGATPPSSPPR